MNQKPLITVILPVKNSAQNLADSLSSILSQTYKNIEVIAIDDASIDTSLSILNKFKKKDKRLRVYKNIKRYGLATTLNRIVKKAKGEFIAFMSPYDISKPQRFEKQYSFLKKNQDFVAVGSQCYFINDLGKILGKSDFPLENSAIFQNALHGISMQFETVLVNKLNLPKDIIKFSNLNPFIYSDIFMKIITYGKFANLKNQLHYHRSRPETYIEYLKNNIFSFFKLWLKSRALYDYRPSFFSFFSPILKSV